MQWLKCGKSENAEDFRGLRTPKKLKKGQERRRIKEFNPLAQVGDLAFGARTIKRPSGGSVLMVARNPPLPARRRSEEALGGAFARRLTTTLTQQKRDRDREREMVGN